MSFTLCQGRRMMSHVQIGSTLRCPRGRESVKSGFISSNEYGSQAPCRYDNTEQKIKAGDGVDGDGGE